MSVDAQRLMDLTTYANVLWSSPLTILIALYFLYDAMGPSVLAGVGVLVLLIPFNIVVSRIARKLQVKCVHLSIKVTVDLQSAFWKMLCLRGTLKKTTVNYVSLES